MVEQLVDYTITLVKYNFREILNGAQIAKLQARFFSENRNITVSLFI